LVDVESLVDHTCSSLGIKEDAYGNVLIAVTEAVNNAIEHGNSFNSDLSVGVTVHDGSKDFCFSISDEGTGFDYDNLPDPTAPENLLKENGRGIFLMKSLSDEIEYEKDGKAVNIYFAK
jgi:serine/threonine-protein kinase RsbW